MNDSRSPWTSSRGPVIANAANGQLMLLAGSHRYTKHWVNWGQEDGLPVVRLATEPGDLTLHYGDTMHSTPPPTGRDAGRRVLYYKFAEQKTFEWVPPACHYKDALFRADATGKVSSRAATYRRPARVRPPAYAPRTPMALPRAPAHASTAIHQRL